MQRTALPSACTREAASGSMRWSGSYPSAGPLLTKAMSGTPSFSLARPPSSSGSSELPTS